MTKKRSTNYRRLQGNGEDAPKTPVDKQRYWQLRRPILAVSGLVDVLVDVDASRSALAEKPRHIECLNSPQTANCILRKGTKTNFSLARSLDPEAAVNERISLRRDASTARWPRAVKWRGGSRASTGDRTSQLLELIVDDSSTITGWVSQWLGHPP